VLIGHSECRNDGFEATIGIKKISDTPVIAAYVLPLQIEIMECELMNVVSMDFVPNQDAGWAYAQNKRGDFRLRIKELSFILNILQHQIPFLIIFHQFIQVS